jgi:hypothetical protein
MEHLLNETLLTYQNVELKTSKIILFSQIEHFKILVMDKKKLVHVALQTSGMNQNISHKPH